jgi:hypothetical protein
VVTDVIFLFETYWTYPKHHTSPQLTLLPPNSSRAKKPQFLKKKQLHEYNQPNNKKKNHTCGFQRACLWSE